MGTSLGDSRRTHRAWIKELSIFCSQYQSAILERVEWSHCSQEGRGAGFSQTSGGDQFVSSSLHQGMGREEREQLLIEFPYISPSSSQSPSLLTTPSRVREHQRTSRPTSIGLNEITPRRTSPSEQRSISFTNMETGESQMVRAVEAPSRKEPNNNNKTSKGTKTANVLKMVRSVFIEEFIISALF